MEYDVFISYRREGGYDTAKHLNDLLVRDGYKVSFDIDTLRSGDFDTQLLTRIEQCEDFILIIDSHAFDRTLDPDFDSQKDWLRCELAHALKHNKNIIPVFLSGVSTFPEGLPDDIIDVVKKNGPEYNKYYFNDFYKKLRTQFMLSRKNRKLATLMYVAIFLIVILISLFVFLREDDNIIYFSPETPHTTNEKEFVEFVYDTLRKIPTYRDNREEIIKEWKIKAKSGEDVSQCYLGLSFFDTISNKEKKISKTAIKWLKRSAKQGNVIAQYALGVCYDNALVVGRDYDKARYYYRMAAEQGLARAQHDYAISLNSNTNISISTSEAFKWAELSAKQHYPPGLYLLAWYYASGTGVKQDIGISMDLIIESAVYDYHWAKYQLACIKLSGQGVFETYKDVDRGVEIMEKLAADGCTISKYQLGILYANGYGVENDWGKAEDLIFEAANEGLAAAQAHLGTWYMMPPPQLYIEQDYAKAMEYFHKAAGQGLPIAYIYIGEMYRMGYGVKRDMDEAGKWFKKAELRGLSYQVLQQYIQQQGAIQQHN